MTFGEDFKQQPVGALCLLTAAEYVGILTPCDIGKTAICLESRPHFLPREFITGGHFKRYQMCQTFALITPSDGSPGLMAAI